MMLLSLTACGESRAGSAGDEGSYARVLVDQVEKEEDLKSLMGSFSSSDDTSLQSSVNYRLLIPQIQRRSACRQKTAISM